MNIEQEIRDEIDNIKQLKMDVGDINNHLNALEGLCRDRNQKAVDDAYKRGYDKGYKDKTNNDEVCKELASEIYQRGLNDAWEAARKIMLDALPNGEHGLATAEIKRIFGSSDYCDVLKSFTAREAIEAMKAYEEKKGKIKVGDVLKSPYSDNEFVVVSFGTTFDGKQTACGFTTNDGNWIAVACEDAVRTNRHHDCIEEIMKEME